MLKYRADLIKARNISPSPNLSNSLIKNDNNTFINNLIISNGILPTSTPFEIHPYKNELPLYLNEKYIIGTFPPISYVLDNKFIPKEKITQLKQPNNNGRPIQKPLIPFYHGSLGSMWDFILTNGELEKLNLLFEKENGRRLVKDYLINFLKNHKINYADIIDTVQRTLNKKSRYDADDKNLFNICVNKDLIKHILSNKNAKFILFNTSSIFGNEGIQVESDKKINVDKNTKSLDIFFRACQELGFQIQIKVTCGKYKNNFEWVNIGELNTSQRRSKILFEVKISNCNDKNNLNLELPNFDEKVLTIITPLSPAAVNRGKTKLNAIVANWMSLNFDKDPSDFLKFAYHSFRNNDIKRLYTLNR